MNRGFLATSRSCYTFQSPNRCWLDFKSGSRIMNLLIDQPSYMYQIIAMTQINVSFQKSEFKTTTIIKILITSSNVTVKALYIFAQKRIHTKRPLFPKATTKMPLSPAPCGLQSKNTLPTACYLCTLQREWVFGSGGWGARWEGVSAVLCTGRGASRDWTLSGGVSRGASLRAHQECRLLISCKGAHQPPKEKQMSSSERHRYFSCPAPYWLADLKLRSRR